jgi:leucyl aminopeptidase
MELKAVIGEITSIETGAIIVDFFEDLERPEKHTGAIDRILDGAISKLIEKGEIKGKPGEITVFHSLGKLPADKVVIVGLGKQAELNADKIRGAIAESCRFLQKKGILYIGTTLHKTQMHNTPTEATAQAVAEGALLGTYSFRKYISKKPDFSDIKQLQLVTGDKNSLSMLEQAIGKGRTIADAANLARDMVNEPANNMTPTHMAKAAREIARANELDINILDQEKMRELGMGALLGVAQGSKQPPKLIILDYRGSASGETDIALLGKGITFDSGGISIKPSEGMGEMKGDMAGGAAVLAAMSAIAQLKPKINVSAFIPATENLPDGNAFKPGDVIRAMNGKTIEVISTDAEGRLVLADALCYAIKLGAKSLIDIATLTGACRVALGNTYTGAFTNNQGLVDRVIAAGKEAGELIWQMPMHEEYRELNKSDVADIKNVGGRYGGAITAAHFLGEFAGEVPWVHLDIAGTSMAEKEKAYTVKGATGVPVRTLINLVLSLAEQ